jgi:flagellin-like hook-associated protein FlgL
MADITLSAAIRSNLLSLANTAKLINRTQDRLSTGLAVNSPVDDAKAFFESKALSDRARTINSIDSIVEQLKGVVNSAASASTGAEFTELNSQYNALILQIDNLAGDASYQGVNLVNATGTTLTVYFSNTTTSTLAISSVGLQHDTGTGLGIKTGATLSVAANRTCAINQLDSAIATLDAKAKSLGSNVALLQTRLDFSSTYANELQGGADKLVLADITEEGANLVALQTRQQLGISALSFAGNSEQSILSLFR